MISDLIKTTLSYVFMAVAMLAFVLATQVIFEWSTSGLKWTTAAAFAGTAFVTAVVHYLLRLCQAHDGETCGDAARRQRIPSFKLVALATSLVVGVAIAFVVQHSYMQPEQVVSTGASELHHMTLPDGTAVHIDVNSRIEVAYTGDERIVYVNAGNSVFDVAKDPKRPFIARTQLVDAMAVGTRFGVAIDRGVTTTVSEGVVTVTARKNIDGAAVTLRAGEELHVASNAVTLPHAERVDAARKLQWADGWLMLGGLTISEGVEQLNRRNRIQIVLDSPELGERVLEFVRVKVDSPEAYAQAIAEQQRGVKINIDRKNGVIRLSE